MLFEPQSTPRLFGVSLAQPFATTFASGLNARLLAQKIAPEEAARIHIITNSARSTRDVREALISQGRVILPQIYPLSDIASRMSVTGNSSVLGMRLSLFHLVERLLSLRPELGAKSSALAMTESLMGLASELVSEGLSPEVLRDIDSSELPEYWQMSEQFLSLIADVLQGAMLADLPETRMISGIDLLINHWQTNPPEHPVFVIGSTASRFASQRLISAVAKLPQGAIVLPGVDESQSADAWEALLHEPAQQDHPQYRIAATAQMLKVSPTAITPWVDQATSREARQRVVSLAMRPAPATDAWLREGPNLPNLRTASQNITLLEAPRPQIEASAIALGIRQALADGKTACVISADRMLTRQISAQLVEWGILADDSAGEPLGFTPFGRFSQLLLELRAAPDSASVWMSVLKHPLCASAADYRGYHLLFTQAFELFLRGSDNVGMSEAQIESYRAGENPPEGVGPWLEWIEAAFALLQKPVSNAADALELHSDLIALFRQGFGEPPESFRLWRGKDGEKLKLIFADLEDHREALSAVPAEIYPQLYTSLCAGEEVREDRDVDPRVRFFGTIEARLADADLVILAGLNEGIWPAQPKPDPWLNRKMRAQIGLLLPDRLIGLEAHDFQMGFSAASEVWISRSKRSVDAETIASRWVNRFVNLLAGLPAIEGDAALETMRTTGARWIAAAEHLHQPNGTIAKAKRPSPRPPVQDRPKRLSVTRIPTLIRDPYAIYARYVLGLRIVNPLSREADAALRGTVIHQILEDVFRAGLDPFGENFLVEFAKISQANLDMYCPWPATRAYWEHSLREIASRLQQDEQHRQAEATPSWFEETGALMLDPLEFTLTGRVDRVDLCETGRVNLYDYKTGKPPSQSAQKSFEKQLLLLSLMMERGAFENIPARQVEQAAFIRAGGNFEIVNAPLAEEPVAQVEAQLRELLIHWRDPQRGYSAKMAAKTTGDYGDYDHLSRFGEWDLSQDPQPQDVGTHDE